MLSTFELLPDEVLMIIFQYSGDVISTFRTFLGLNWRLNQVLLDRRLHLFTDFLHTTPNDDYYRSDIFQQISQQLSFVNVVIDKQELSQHLQPLITFHIQQRYVQLGNEFASARERFQFIREPLASTVKDRVDRQLQEQFDQLLSTLVTKDYFDRVKRLVLTDGARLECEAYELSQFNLCKAINNLVLPYISDRQLESSSRIDQDVELIKVLLISNPSNLKNRDYVGNGGCCVAYFVLHGLYRLHSFYSSMCSSQIVALRCYRETVDLFLFILQCYRQAFDNANDIRSIMFDLLQMMPTINEDLFIRTAQWEVFRIVASQNASRSDQQSDEHDGYRMRSVIKRLVANQRSDVLEYLCRDLTVRDIFLHSDSLRELVDSMTSSPTAREFFSQLLRAESIDFLRSNKTLLFILLDKKERQLLVQLLTCSPYLLHEVDEEGNDCLLRLCLKVFGCRHRMIAYLLSIGSDTERRNGQGQNFHDALQVPRNRKLLKQLIEHEIIQSK